MISVGSMLRFTNHNGPWETAIVLRSYMCEDTDCCCLAPDDRNALGEALARAGEVVDILWNNGQVDTDYHLEGLSSDQVEVIPQ